MLCNLSALRLPSALTCLMFHTSSRCFTFVKSLASQLLAQACGRFPSCTSRLQGFSLRLCRPLSPAPAILVFTHLREPDFNGLFHHFRVFCLAAEPLPSWAFPLQGVLLFLSSLATSGKRPFSVLTAERCCLSDSAGLCLATADLLEVSAGGYTQSLCDVSSCFTRSSLCAPNFDNHETGDTLKNSSYLAILRHPLKNAYRCFLPDLTGFTSLTSRRDQTFRHY